MSKSTNNPNNKDQPNNKMTLKQNILFWFELIILEVMLVIELLQLKNLDELRLAGSISEQACYSKSQTILLIFIITLSAGGTIIPLTVKHKN